jgi:hypothetical protein
VIPDPWVAKQPQRMERCIKDEDGTVRDVCSGDVVTIRRPVDAFLLDTKVPPPTPPMHLSLLFGTRPSALLLLRLKG